MRTMQKTVWLLVVVMVVVGGSPLFGTGQEETSGGADEVVRIEFMKRGWENKTALTPVLADYVRDEWGIQIDWILPNRDVYNEQVNIEFASGDYPAMMDIPNYNVIAEAAENGVLLSMDDVVAEHPVWSTVDAGEFSSTSVNGVVYGLPRIRTAPNVMVYREDWADRLGIDPPEGADEFYEMMRAFAQDDPDGNGVDDTYALSSRHGFLTTDVVLVEPFWMYFLPDAPNELYQDSEGTWRPVWNESDALAEALVWLNSAYEGGLIDPEFVIDGRSSHQAKFESGVTGIWQKQPIWVNSAYQNLLANHPEAVVSVVPSVVNAYGVELYQAAPTSLTVYVTDAAEPNEDLIKGFYAWFQSAEGYRFQETGIEGETYEVVDGQFRWLSEDLESVAYWPAPMTLAFPPFENPPGLGDFERKMLEQTDYTPVENYTIAAGGSAHWNSIRDDVQKSLKEIITEAILGTTSVEDALDAIEAMNNQLDVDAALQQINATS